MKKQIHDKNGFTLIEILIAMSIFGFILYIMSAILIVVIQTTHTINARSSVRSAIESAISNMTQDIQFAQNIVYCPITAAQPLHTCISFDVPSYNGQSASDVKTETVYYDSTLSTLKKDVTINSGATQSTSLVQSGTKITQGYFDIELGDLLVSATSQVDTGTHDNNNNEIFKPLTLNSIIQYDR